MIFLANAITFLGLVCLGLLFKAISWQWGQDAMVVFCLGWIGATVVWQCAHKMRYGIWFDEPVLRMTGGATGAPEPAKSLAMSGEMPGAGGKPPPDKIKR